MFNVFQFDDPLDTKMFTALVQLYEPHPIAPILHQALTGNGLMHIFIVNEAALGRNRRPVAAGILKTAEIFSPIGEGVSPVAWVIGDMITHSDFRRCGAATQLLSIMETAAIREGGRIIYLYTEGTNEAAKCLYEKAGYLRLRNQGDNAVYVKVVTDDPDAALLPEAE